MYSGLCVQMKSEMLKLQIKLTIEEMGKVCYFLGRRYKLYSDYREKELLTIHMNLLPFVLCLSVASNDYQIKNLVRVCIGFQQNWSHQANFFLTDAVPG